MRLQSLGEASNAFRAQGKNALLAGGSYAVLNQYPDSLPGLNFGGAGTLLGSETQGLSIDFTDQSMVIRDTTTPANTYVSQGTVSNGSLIGPGGKLTYSSPSPKMTLQSGGTFQFNPHNLFLNSAAPANQSVTVKSGLTYAIDITGSVQTTVSGATSGTLTAGTTAFTAASGTLTFASTSGSGTVQVRQTPSASTYVATSGSTAFSLPYEWNTSGVCQGVLEEEARTNLLLQSNTFGTTWTNGGITNLTTTTTGPDGITTSAVQLNETTASVQHYVRQGITKAASALAYTTSVFAKVGTGRTRITIAYFSSLNNGIQYSFDLSGGQTSAAKNIGTPFTSTSAQIISCGNGWYRCIVTATTDTDTSLSVQIGSDNGSGTGVVSDAFAGTVGNGCYIYQAQLEQASYLSSPLGGSPVFTATATVTRSQDHPNLAVANFPTSNVIGSAYAKATVANIASGDKGVITMTDTNGEMIFVNTATIKTFDGTNTVSSGITATANTVFKAASSWTTSGSVLLQAVNGNNAVSGTFDGTMGTNTTLLLGDLSASTGSINGYLQQVMILPRAWSAAEAKAMAT